MAHSRSWRGKLESNGENAPMVEGPTAIGHTSPSGWQESTELPGDAFSSVPSDITRGDLERRDNPTAPGGQSLVIGKVHLAKLFRKQFLMTPFTPHNSPCQRWNAEARSERHVRWRSLMRRAAFLPPVRRGNQPSATSVRLASTVELAAGAVSSFLRGVRFRFKGGTRRSTTDRIEETMVIGTEAPREGR